jgi:hypothetical protein
MLLVVVGPAGPTTTNSIATTTSRAGSEKMVRVGEGWGENGEVFFDRPKLTVGCSANGRRRRRIILTILIIQWK